MELLYVIAIIGSLVVGFVGYVILIPFNWGEKKLRTKYYADKYNKPHFYDVVGDNYEEKLKFLNMYEDFRFDKVVENYNWQTVGEDWGKVSEGDYVKWVGFEEEIKNDANFKIENRLKPYEIEGKVKLNDGIGIVNSITQPNPLSDNMCIKVSFPRYNFKYPGKYIFSKSFYLKTTLYRLSFDDLLHNKI